MLIAQDKRKNNIAEYILYMWQIEDLIRANQCNFDKVAKNIVAQYQTDPSMHFEISEWYKGLCESMISEGIQKQGHLDFVHDTLNELAYLHRNLLASEKEVSYQQLYVEAKPQLDLLRSKSEKQNIDDITLSFNALYGILLLRLQKKEISAETHLAVQAISQLISFLAGRYHQIRNKATASK
jgi:hypothetical protein